MLRYLIILFLLFSCKSTIKENQLSFNSIDQAKSWYFSNTNFEPKHEIIKSNLSEAVVIWPKNTDKMMKVKVLVIAKKLNEEVYSKSLVSIIESSVNPSNNQLLIFDKIIYDKKQDYLGFYSSGELTILFQGLLLDVFSGAIKPK